MSYLNDWKTTNDILKKQAEAVKKTYENAIEANTNADAEHIAFIEAQRAVNESFAQLDGFYENLGSQFADINAVRDGYAEENNPYASLSDAQLNNAFSNLSQDSIQLLDFIGSNPHQYSQDTIDGTRYSSDPDQPAQLFDINTPEGAFQEALANPEYRNQLGQEAVVALFEAIPKAKLAIILKDHPILKQALENASFGDAIKESLFGDEGSGFNFPAWMDGLRDMFNDATDTPDPILTLRNIGMRGGDPLILDLNGDGVELVQLENSTARFDVNGDDFATPTGWVNAEDGLLVLDKNSNGRIDSVNELFGNTTLTGFEELALYDSNLDGKINSEDDVFSDLKIWQDRNQDGISQASELTSLNNRQITAIGSYQAATKLYGCCA